MSYLGLMQSTCTIERHSNTPDARGVVTPSWTENATGVQCQLVELAGKEVMTAQGWGLEVDYRLLLPAGTTIRSHPPDRVVISSVNYLVHRVDTERNKTLIAWVKRQA